VDAERIQQLHYDRIAIEYEAHYGDACSQRYRDKFFHQPMFKGMDLSGLQVIEAMCGSGHTTQYLISQGGGLSGWIFRTKQLNHSTSDGLRARGSAPRY